MTPTTAALGRAILNLESEAGKMHIEASFARSNGDAEHARFYLTRESQAREDAKTLESLMARGQESQLNQTKMTPTETPEPLGWRLPPPNAPGWWLAWDRYAFTLHHIQANIGGNLVTVIDGKNRHVETICWAACWMPVPAPELVTDCNGLEMETIRRLSTEKP